MSVLLRDGDWMASIPVLGAVVLPASLIAGMLVATSQTAPLWAYDFWAAPVMIAIGALGAGPGTWAALGYLIGLLFLWHDDQGRGLWHAPIGNGYSYSELRETGNGILHSFTHATLPVLVVAIVLMQLAVIVPTVAAGCRGLLSRLLQRQPMVRTVVEGVLSTVIIAVFAYQWQLAAQYAIRPFWTFTQSISSPETAPFDVLRSLGWMLVGVAVIVSVLRWTATLLLPRHPAAVLTPPAVKRIELPWPLTIAGQGLVVTLLGAGVLATVGQGVVFFAIVAGSLILRGFVLPRIPRLARIVNLVPVAIRLVVLFVVAYLISEWRVGAAYAAGAQDLTSFAETAALVILVSALVLVAPRPRPWLPSWIGRRGAALSPRGTPGKAAGRAEGAVRPVRPKDGGQQRPGGPT